MGTMDYRQLAHAPDQTELPFVCVTYGMNAAAKNSLPESKHIAMARVHKSLPRIIQ